MSSNRIAGGDSCAVDDLGERAHLELPVGAADAQELARALDALDRLAQIRVRALVLVPELCLDRLFSRVP